MGDGGYDYNPIKHLTKSEAYILARKIGVPLSIVEKYHRQIYGTIKVMKMKWVLITMI